MASGAGLLVLLGLAALGGAAVVAVATLPRISDLEQRVDALEGQNEYLRQKTVRQDEHIQSLAGYLKEQDRRITGLESEVTNLGQLYESVIVELTNVENQVEDEEVKQLIRELIARARLRKQQRAQAVPTDFAGFR